MKTKTTTTVKIEPMPSFEGMARGLEKFCFANQQSLINALLALRWVDSLGVYPRDRFPMVVIIGPEGSGKTVLERMMTRASQRVVRDCGRDKMTKLLGHVSRQGIDFLVLEEPSEAQCRSAALARFLTSRVYSERRVRGSEKAEYPVDTMVIMEGQPGLQLSPELARRSIVIELAMEPRSLLEKLFAYGPGLYTVKELYLTLAEESETFPVFARRFWQTCGGREGQGMRVIQRRSSAGVRVEPEKI